jgi:hypothetical protein
VRLQLIRPHVEPTEFEMRLTCPYQDCQSTHFRHHQEVDNPVKDTKYEAVSALATSVCGASGPSGCILVR